MRFAGTLTNQPPCAATLPKHVVALPSFMLRDDLATPNALYRRLWNGAALMVAKGRAAEPMLVVIDRMNNMRVIVLRDIVSPRAINLTHTRVGNNPAVALAALVCEAATTTVDIDATGRASTNAEVDAVLIDIIQGGGRTIAAAKRFLAVCQINRADFTLAQSPLRAITDAEYLDDGDTDRGANVALTGEST